MSMKAQLRQKGKITILALDGHTEYQNSEEFRTNLIKIYEKHGADNIVIDLAGLDFVGSSGIRNFVDALKEVNQINSKKPVLCGVKSEFRKIFHVMAKDTLNIFESEDKAIETLIPENKKKSNA